MAKNNKIIKEKDLYQDLQERYEEMHDVLLSLLDDQKRNEEDLKYLNEFIHYKKLDEEFRYFRENAHEKYEEDLPFPCLTL